MITENEQTKLKSILGTYYSEEVVSILEEKGVRNKNGFPHNKQYVLQVFCGHRNNPDVEAAIWELALRRKKEAAAAQQKKNQILNKAS